MEFDNTCNHELIREVPHWTGDINMIISFDSHLDARLAHFKLANMGIMAPLTGLELQLAPLAYKSLFGKYYEDVN